MGPYPQLWQDVSLLLSPRSCSKRFKIVRDIKLVQPECQAVFWVTNPACSLTDPAFDFFSFLSYQCVKEKQLPPAGCSVLR